MTEYDTPFMSRNKWLQDYHKKMIKFAIITYALIFLACVIGRAIWIRATDKFVDNYYDNYYKSNNNNQNNYHYTYGNYISDNNLTNASD